MHLASVGFPEMIVRNDVVVQTVDVLEAHHTKAVVLQCSRLLEGGQQSQQIT